MAETLASKQIQDQYLTVNLCKTNQNITASGASNNSFTGNADALTFNVKSLDKGGEAIPVISNTVKLQDPSGIYNIIDIR